MDEDVMDKDKLADLIAAALEAIPGLDARNVKIESMRTDHDIDTDASKARVEITFDFH